MTRVVIGLPKVYFDLSSSKFVSSVETFLEYQVQNTRLVEAERTSPYSPLHTTKNLVIHDDVHMTFLDFVIDHTTSMTNCQISS
jgi:hypothetical protein